MLQRGRNTVWQSQCGGKLWSIRPLARGWGNYMYGIIRAISITLSFCEHQWLFSDPPSTESFPHFPLNVNDGLCNKAVALIYSAYRGGKSVTLEDMPLTWSPSRSLPHVIVLTCYQQVQGSHRYSFQHGYNRQLRFLQWLPTKNPHRINSPRYYGGGMIQAVRSNMHCKLHPRP